MDGRRNNGADYKYGEPKRTHKVNLTDRAWEYYKENKMSDWIELECRGLHHVRII